MKGGRRLAGGPQARYLMLGATAALVLLGLVIVYSASSVADYVEYGDTAYDLKRHAIWIVLGVMALLAAERFDYRVLRGPTASRLPLWIWGVSLGALVSVSLWGVEKYGARRWIVAGPVTLQPSEFAKFACVLVAAYVLNEWRLRRMEGSRAAITVLATAGIVLAIVAKEQKDLGTAASIALAVLIVAVLGGAPWRTIGMAAAGGLALVGAAVMAEPYRVTRMLSFLDKTPDLQGDGWQINQAMLAFGSGGIDGVGLGLSRQKFFYLPAAHTDFIFAIVGEELGLLGTLLVVAGFATLAYAGFRVALGAKDPFGRLLAGGVTAMIVTQALVNMAAVTKMLPVTGIPLPLVSAGGSSLIFTMGCIGVVLSVSRHGARLSSVGRPTRPPQEGPRREVPAERRRDGRSRLPGVDGGRRLERRRA